MIATSKVEPNDAGRYILEEAKNASASVLVMGLHP
jgi:hypothetical protein